MHTLRLSAMDSPYATDAEIAIAQIDPTRLPPDFRMMAHQARTIAALCTGDTPIVINTAKTGDGKSFAGLYPALALGWKTMTLYPTNELARDQLRSLEVLRGRWQQPSVQRVRLSLINAAEIDTVEQAMKSGRTEALSEMLDDLVLTNPDIFHLMMQFRYRARGAAADLVATEIVNKYRLFTFDEFHIFGAPENASAVIAMLLLDALHGDTRRLKFLFLSATPQDQLQHLARMADLTYTEIEGEYLHGLPEPPETHRRILQRVDLNLYERGDGLEAWVDANIDRIIGFFQANPPAARGVILANSIATAHRVHERLIAPCRAAGIDLGAPNTGLTPPPLRRTDAALFVATSTIDVGVDFKINFLVFESLDMATHTQRLGRLGRHDKNAEGQSFGARYEAHALLPGWVIEAVQKALPEGSEVDREAYGEIIKNAYLPPQVFGDYYKRWGSLQAGHVIATLASKEIRQQYKQTRMRLEARLKTPFPNCVIRTRDIYTESPAIFDEAGSFRGSSPFTALVVDKKDAGQTVQSYNLITLLRSGELESLDLEAAYRRAGEAAEALRKRDSLAAYRLLGWLPKSRRLAFSLDAETRAWGGERFETVIEQMGFQLVVEGASIPALSELNQRLEVRSLVVLLVRNKDPESLRRRYQLGMQVELFPFRSYDDFSSGCAAFGRDALLLDSLVYRDRNLAREVHQDAPLFG